MIKTREPSPEMAAASKPSGFRAKRRAWRDDEEAIIADKQVTNGEQSDNEQVTNGEQSDNEQVTNGEQSDNENTETVNKRVSQPITSRLTNGEQSDNKRITKYSFFQLVGLQKRVTLYIYGSCQLTRSSISGPITLEEMSETLESPKGSIKTTTNRLRKKFIITTVDQKEGRGGFTKYRLDDSIYQEILHNETVNKRLTNGEQKVNKRVSEPITEPITSLSSSSSSNIDINNKTTTTEGSGLGDQSERLFSADWEQIDFSDPVLAEIHFGRPQLKQWHDRKYCTAGQAQESIYHFAFYLKHAKKGEIKTGPLNFFMGIMAKQKYFPRPDGYLSPEEEALKRRAEDLKKKSESLENLERELYYAAFEIWFRSLTEDEVQAFVPTVFQYESRKSALRGVFLDKYWLKIKSNPNLDPAKWRDFDTKNQDASHSLSVEEVRLIADQQFGVREVSSSGAERVT